MGESNADCSCKEDTSMTGSVTNELETNFMNESSGDLSLNVDISNTGSVGQELGRKVTNPSNCDCSIKDSTKILRPSEKNRELQMKFRLIRK